MSLLATIINVQGNIALTYLNVCVTLDFSLSVSSCVKVLVQDVEKFLEYDLVSYMYNIDTQQFLTAHININYCCCMADRQV